MLNNDADADYSDVSALGGAAESVEVPSFGLTEDFLTESSSSVSRATTLGRMLSSEEIVIDSGPDIGETTRIYCH